ncbi:hypothetical protein LguiA_008224 [Lonicera macranthoides]
MASKSIMVFLLVATMSLLLLSSSHISIAQARVERKSFALSLVRALANGAARVGQNMSWKSGKDAILKFFNPEAKKNFRVGEKVIEFLDTMKDIATLQCNNTFCVNVNLKCEPCSSNSPFTMSCDPYCVLKLLDNNTLSCILPCGPPVDDNGGVSPITSPSD